MRAVRGVCSVQGECKGCLSCVGSVRLQGARCGFGLVGAYRSLLSTCTTHEVDAGRVRLYMGVVGSGHCSFCLLVRIKDIHDCQWSGGFPLVNDGSLCVNMRYSMWSVGQSPHTPLTHHMHTTLTLTYHMCMRPSHPSHIISHTPLTVTCTPYTLTVRSYLSLPLYSTARHRQQRSNGEVSLPPCGDC